VDVIQASYYLLQSDEQRLLAVLSVFAGAFTAVDAEAVSAAGTGLAPLLRALVDSSWLMVTRGADQNRFSMLDSMRTFATARLAESASGPQARRRHADRQGRRGPLRRGARPRITVSVPAGSYSATVVDQVMNEKILGYAVSDDTKTWLANGVGPVKEQTNIGAGPGATGIVEVLKSFTKG
jgi:hypothetical protein